MSTHVLAARPREFSFSGFRLVVTDGPDQGRVESSSGSEFAVGTGEGNHLVLSDPSVSRHHFVIMATPRGLHLRDVGSTNGTYLAGHRVESAWLESGALLRAGVSLLRFESTSNRVCEPLSEEARFGGVLGRSLMMRKVFAPLPRIAASDSTVLLEGETGTGKSLIARAIHQASPRARGPLVVVDCGAIPPTLIESELFGHERGAFTGAVAARVGAFEAAAGGTLFLDEVGELPLDMQPKLLRALEDRLIKRVGSTVPTRLDLRVIAASNRDLRQAVNRGALRGDLYYRLNIVKLRLPPLRERPDDIPLLVEAFYRELSGRPDAQVPADLLAALVAHDWPGNVRELRAAVERALLIDDQELWLNLSDPMDDKPSVERADQEALGSGEFDDTLSFRAAKERATIRWERSYLGELYRRHQGNLSRAARAARMDRTHLRELLRRYKLLDRE